jgi:uncharacterized membrane protein
MAGKINLLGHPVHPMLIVFPLGLLPSAVACDIIYLVHGGAHWAHFAYWLIAAGVLSGLFAAIFGFADWLALPAGTRAKRIGLWHAVVMVIVVILFAVSWWSRRANPNAPSTLAIGVGIVAVAIALIGGWLGGELVYRLSVGVDFDAHVNSPSSLSSRPASDNKETLPASQREG